MKNKNNSGNGTRWLPNALLSVVLVACGSTPAISGQSVSPWSTLLQPEIATFATALPVGADVLLVQQATGPLIALQLTLIDGRNGRVRWTTLAEGGGDPFHLRVAAADDALVVVASGLAVAIEHDDGAIRWNVPYEPAGGFELLATRQHALLLDTETRALVALTMSSGRQRASRNFDNAESVSLHHVGSAAVAISRESHGPSLGINSLAGYHPTRAHRARWRQELALDAPLDARGARFLIARHAAGHWVAVDADNGAVHSWEDHEAPTGLHTDRWIVSTEAWSGQLLRMQELVAWDMTRPSDTPHWRRSVLETPPLTSALLHDDTIVLSGGDVAMALAQSTGETLWVRRLDIAAQNDTCSVLFATSLSLIVECLNASGRSLRSLPSQQIE